MTLEGPILKKVTNIFLIINIVNIGRWIGIAIGIILNIYGTFRYFKDKQEATITPVHHQVETVSNNLNRRSSTGLSTDDKVVENRKVRTILNGHEFERY